MDQLLLGGALINVAVVLLLIKKKKRKNRNVWCRDWINRKNYEGGTILKMLNEELRVEDAASYNNYLRMPENLFNLLLTRIEGRIARQNTVMRESIAAKSRLQITLRFLATGESYKSLMYSTRVHETTIGRFIPQVCEALVKELKHVYLKMPNTEEEWKNIAQRFYDLWDFPNCLGALDGRHIVFNAARKDGSFYRNYKGTDSIVLLGLVDADYRFTYCHIGTNGRISDGGVLRESGLLQTLEERHLPPNKALDNENCACEVPYVMVADDAFPLCNRIMKPYAQRDLTHDKRVFNYRLSRARRIVENAFGILANRFRVLLNPMNLPVEKVEIITFASVALHNFLSDNNKEMYLAVKETMLEVPLEKVGRICGNRCSQSSQKIRDNFKTFLNGAGARHWQDFQVAQNNL